MPVKNRLIEVESMVRKFKKKSFEAQQLKVKARHKKIDNLYKQLMPEDYSSITEQVLALVVQEIKKNQAFCTSSQIIFSNNKKDVIIMVESLVSTTTIL